MTEPAPRRRRSLPAQIEESAEATIERATSFTDADLLPSGSTLLNLACSGRVAGAFRKKKMVNLIGDSSSGKSLLSMQCLIEACFCKHFDGYELYYDDVEGGCDFNIHDMYGERASAAADDRIQFISSASVEEWQDRMQDLQKREAKFIYILDSYDVLDSVQAKAQAEAEAKARAAGKEVSGSYGMDKVKRIRALFRPALAAMKKTDSIVIIISQTKAVIDPRSFKKKTRSAEDALEFHSYHCVWLANAGKEVSKEIDIGTKTRLQVKKNRLTGRRREVAFSIFTEIGIDDIGSCIDFMVDKGFWKQPKQTIEAHDLGLTGTKQKLIREIEAGNKERALRRAVGKAWQEVEESVRLCRKDRY